MPGMAWCMVLFLASLIGIPPLGGWYAKFGVFKVLVGAETGLGWATAIIMAINTAIAAYYYLNVAKAMIFDDAPDGDTAPAPRTPPSLSAAVGIALVATFAFGVPARPADQRHGLRPARPRRLTPPPAEHAPHPAGSVQQYRPKSVDIAEQNESSG